MNIRLNVGGVIFETEYETIIKIPYFCAIEVCKETNEVIFINRSSHIFKHILGLAIDPLYPFPSKYKSELDFYGMNYDNLKLHEFENNVMTQFENIYEELQEIKHYLQTNNFLCIKRGCDFSRLAGSLFCHNHVECLGKGCHECQPIGYNYCKLHETIGQRCNKGGCDNGRKGNSMFCDEHA